MRYLPILLILVGCSKDPVPVAPKNVVTISDKDSISENIVLVKSIMKKKVSSCNKICDLSLLYLKEVILSHSRICNITNEPEAVTFDQDVETTKKFIDRCRKNCKK